MLPGWLIFSSALLYMALLFVIAAFGDRRASRRLRQNRGRPIIYALSLAIYCTSWTYYGGVGLAANRGLEFIAIYVGPVLMFTVGMPLIRRIVMLAKSERITSIADFMAARYGKNPAVAAIVALIALIGSVPYIALQLKAVSGSVSAMIDIDQFHVLTDTFVFADISLFVTIALAIFAMIFGTRHTDATEHQDGLILAVAMESLVKLVAFTVIGLTVVFLLYSGPGDLMRAAAAREEVRAVLNYETSPARWLLLILLSAAAIILLPRQFHVTVVENRTPSELKLARWLLPLYLVAINLFVLPVAIAGLIQFGSSEQSDLFVLSLPLANDMPVVALIAFIGGFSAATAMVIVASVAVAIMVSNDLVVPLVLRNRDRRLPGRLPEEDFSRTILWIRRTAIGGILFLGFAYYRATDINAGLASIGLLSFAAIAQLAPAFFGGLFWRHATARGAIAGLVSGILVWAYMLLLPSLGGPDNSPIAAAILSFIVPGIEQLGGSNDPLFNAVALSLIVNCLFYVLGSLMRRPRSVERVQAAVFIPESRRPKVSGNGWKSKVTVGDLKQTISRYLGAERTDRSFLTYEQTLGQPVRDDDPADMGLLRFSEQLLGSAVGSSSARLVLTLLFQRADELPGEAARLLNEASNALQYNRDLLQTALGQLDTGITVFDSSNQLIIWNRRFREMFNLPESVGQVGTPLESILRILSERGDIPKGMQTETLQSFLTMDRPFTITTRPGTRGGNAGADQKGFDDGKRIVEIRSNPMPGSGFVTSYSDITERVAADAALKQVNETLEQRVEERTAELTRVNVALEKAQQAAEDANLGKTRFLAAAGHDILQPLNAARLYSSTLVERLGETGDRELVANIDSSLESVETILGAVLDISRLDGVMKPQISSFPLQDVLARVKTDFAPVAKEKNLRFTAMPTGLHVYTDPNLLRRLIQNLVSNAIKYTRQGRVVIGVRRRGTDAVVQVLDTGIGIPSSKFTTVFKEFARLDEGVRTADGLGLGLSIVDRIAAVLKLDVTIASTPGKGTEIRVRVPLAAAGTARRPAQPHSVRPAPDRLDGMRVLCIDNEEKILEGMQLLLSGWGCVVTTASSLDMAMQAAVRPEVILADYHLDDGLGTEAIIALRRHWNSDIPGLLVTADRTSEVRVSAEAAGIAVQHKPIKPASLRAFLARFAAQGRSAAE
ncbi:PAS domain-containing hybrid sensor histidine kinase/response regulator [Pseudohoeflea coraliihabitans]|uniref:histidine kinase n=1 Tax=Pseudohoeflea coraliihabitans TaxID=2860393 RepID=A0ABS6WNA6_9HYPH|nr:PAS domain-containing hybrid sensor histidine kinase/response regulator [Pseudohoeflea sp. DP4N28-3]MBW3097444.1 hybrid sensor histidine kinase/response regulator [Pseudohoeflea sp. DP4N28-3]